jgi:hypothetical protein
MPGGDLQPDPPPMKSRTPATWAKLLAVWCVGLVSWALYLVAILYLWMKFM